jgi:integrase
LSMTPESQKLEDLNLKKNNILISELFLKVYQHLWDTERFHKSGYAEDVTYNYKKHIEPHLGTYDATLLTRKRIKLWYQKLSNTPNMANRCLEVLSRMYSFAIDMEWLDASPCLHIKQIKEKKRNRYATETEVKAIGAVLEANEKKFPLAVAYLRTMLFTGSRPKALECLRWEDIIIGGEASTISFDGKTSAETGEKETLVIPNHIVDMWKTLPTRPDGLVFGPVNYRILWAKIKKEAGCKDLWARDLRRTFATIGMSNGVDMNVISELLNHQSVQTTKLYAKLNSTARIEAATIISDKIKGLL